jgi:hypothetical protein
MSQHELGSLIGVIVVLFWLAMLIALVFVPRLVRAEREKAPRGFFVPVRERRRRGCWLLL